MNGADQKQSATGGVPSLPSVLAPLAGYRYAKSINDRELMKTEAMKFKGKMYDERVKMTETHNKEVRGLQSKLDEANQNLEVAKSKFKAQTDFSAKANTALRSQMNRLTTKLIDMGIDAAITEGVGNEYVQAIRGMEELHGKKFEDLTPEEQDIWSRRATKQSLMTHQALIARSATTTGGVVGSQQNVDDLAAGEDTRPKQPELPSPPTNADAAIVNKMIADGDLEGAKEFIRKKEEIKASGSRTGTKAKAGLDNTGQKRIGEIVRNNIVSTIQIPEKIDVNNRFDKTSGMMPTDEELNELTRGLVDSLDVKRTLPANMLNIVREIESQAEAGLRILQGESPTPILDRDNDGRIVFHRNTSIEDRVKARQHAAVVAYFDSAQGQAFKKWLNESASNSNAYKIFFPSQASTAQPAQDDSGNTFGTTDSPGDQGGSPETTPPNREPSPRPALRTSPIVPNSETEMAIREKLGIDWGSGDWLSRPLHPGYRYRVTGFFSTGDPSEPIKIKAERYDQSGGTRSVWISIGNLDSFVHGEPFNTQGR